MTAMAVMVLLAGAAAPMVARRLDPERARKDAEGALARGEVFSIKGKQVPPGTLHWVIGGVGPPKPDPVEDCFTVETMDLGLLEVVADPGRDRYRFQVEVRHDGAGQQSHVGLYFGYREVGAGDGTRQGRFFALRYTDRVPPAKRVGPDGKPVVVKVAVECRCFADRPGKLYAPHVPVGVGLPIEPTNPFAEPGPWRTLTVEVRPEGVKASWLDDKGNEVTVDEASSALLEKLVRGRKAGSKLLSDVPTEHRPRSGLGLYIFGGKASFRRIVVEPLAP
jgi:hypothetical protein